MRPLHGFFVLALGVTTAASYSFAPPTAHAEKSARQQAKEHTQLGSKYQKLGEFEKAIAEYKAAYELVPHPQLLYNLGQAYRLKGDREQALEAYETFVSIETTGAAAEKARGFIVLLKEAIAADAAKPEPVAEPIVPDEPADPAAVEPTAVTPGPPDPSPGADPSTPPTVDLATEAPPLAPRSPLDREGWRLGAAWSFVDHDFGDGVGPSVQAGYEFLRKGIALRPSARLDYLFLSSDGDGANALLHLGAEVRVQKHFFGRVIPYAAVGIGYNRFSDVNDGGQEIVNSPSVHINIGLEVLAIERFALGIMYLGTFLDQDDDNRTAFQGGGFTISRY
jgi:tetratricopeptide (TPR) repeat protein